MTSVRPGFRICSRAVTWSRSGRAPCFGSTDIAPIVAITQFERRSSRLAQIQDDAPDRPRSWRRAGASRRAVRDPHSCWRGHARQARPRGCMCPQAEAKSSVQDAPTWLDLG